MCGVPLVESYISACPPHKPNSDSVKGATLKQILSLGVPPPLDPALSRSLPDLAPPWQKCMIATTICVKESGMEEISWGKSSFFNTAGALLAVVGCFACGEGWQTNSPCSFYNFISCQPSSGNGTHTQELSSLQLLTNLNVSGMIFKSTVWLWLVAGIRLTLDSYIRRI